MLHPESLRLYLKGVWGLCPQESGNGRWIEVLNKGLGYSIAALVFLGLMGAPLEGSAKTRGLSVQLRASEAKDAPVAETVELYSKSHALVIGIDDYANGWPRLSNAIKDARAIARELERNGFDVTLKTNLNSSALDRSLKEFFAIKGSDPEARLFLWYAGHGHTEDGEGYLIPSDAPRPDGSGRFRLSALSLRRIGEYVRLAQSKHAFGVFDSCFSGTVFESARALPPAAVTRATTLPVRQFLTSGDAGQTVSDDGTFRELFIRALRGEERADANSDGYVTASEMGLFLSDRVTNLTQSKQTPRYGKLRDKDWDRGDFVFQLASVAPTRKVSNSSGGQTPEMLFWQSIQNSERASDYGAYLTQYPKGSFAALARSRLSGLKEKKVASRSPPSFIVEGLDETLVALRSANVRELPTASSTKVATLKAGSAVEVTGKTRFEGKDWYRVAVSGRAAYVFGTLLGKKATPVVSHPPKVEVRPKATPVVGVYPKRKAPGETFRDCADCPEMVVIPSGSFRMGDLSGAGQNDEKPVHDVRIDYSFAVGKYEVTQDEWQAVMGSNPSHFKGGRNPVEVVSWDGAKSFVRKLSARTGKTYRLLSESEWEYMARAGTSSAFYTGSTISPSQANFDGNSTYNGSSKGEYRKRTVAVGSFGANKFGVHDVHGNVWEWVEDCWHDSYSGAPSNGNAWTSGGDCAKRVLRGGSWYGGPWDLRSAYRGRLDTSGRINNIGFRIARTLSR